MKENKPKIRFIVNPHSGASRKRNLPDLIQKNIDHSQFDVETCLTEYAGHGKELAKAAVDLGFWMVVACGGDGSRSRLDTATNAPPTDATQPSPAISQASTPTAAAKGPPPPGTSNVTIRSGDRDRQYILHIPPKMANPAESVHPALTS